MNPGTDQPASFQSLVLVQTPGKEPGAPITIEMNQPLKQGGYVFYQASYQPMDNGGYLSVFSVARDPGMELKYAGSLILVAGISFMFWFKKTLTVKDAVRA